MYRIESPLIGFPSYGLGTVLPDGSLLFFLRDVYY